MTVNQALIKGAKGQDSAQMTGLPLEEGYAVTGIVGDFSHTSVRVHPFTISRLPSRSGEIMARRSRQVSCHMQDAPLIQTPQEELENACHLNKQVLLRPEFTTAISALR